MSLTAADVAEIMRLVEASGFDELSLELNGVKLNLRRGAAPAEKSPAPLAPSAIATPAPARSAAPKAPEKAAASANPNLHDVTAPLLGTFYRAPKPGAPPFVEVGAAVDADTVIGIIEVMKLMNTVRAGTCGTVAEILAGDAALVEYGETILRINTPG